MYSKRLVRVVPSVLCILTGCHSQQFGNLSPDQQLAADQVQLNSALESDRAGIVFAQKTLELAQQQQSQAGAGQSKAQSVQQANVDLYIANTMLHLNEDRQKVIADLFTWRAFAKSLEAQSTAKEGR